MKNIFISYSHRDEQIVRELADKFTAANNYSVWLRRDSFIGDNDTAVTQIEEKILKSDLFVSFISKAYIESTSCRREFFFANNCKEKCIYVLLEKLHMHDARGFATYLYGEEIRFDAYKLFKQNLSQYANDIYENLEKALDSYFNARSIEHVDAGKRGRVYISYIYHSKELVKKFADKLKQSNFAVWLDHDRLATGDSIPRKTEDAILGSEVVICFISRHYLQSANCRLDFFFAHNCQKKCIHIVLERLAMDDMKGLAPYLFGEEIRLDAYKFAATDCQHLANEIYAKVEPALDAYYNQARLKPLSLNEAAGTLEGHSVYISYCYNSKQLVETFADKLTQNNFTVWLDQNKLSTGDSIPRETEKAILNAQIVVCFISRRYLESLNCRLDFFFANNCRKKCVYVILETIDRNDMHGMAPYVYGEATRLMAFKFNIPESNYEQLANEIYTQFAFTLEADN